jgi:hypothetical protein
MFVGTEMDKFHFSFEINISYSFPYQKDSAND